MIDTSSRISFTRAIEKADLITILSLMEEGYQFSAISEDTIPVQHNVNNWKSFTKETW